jgi:hypothetical protein
MLVSQLRGAIALAALSFVLLGCDSSSLQVIEDRGTVSGTVIDVQVYPQLTRIRVQIDRDDARGGQAQVNVYGSREGGSNALFRSVLAGTLDGSISNGRKVTFFVADGEVRTGIPMYLATKWRRR